MQYSAEESNANKSKKQQNQSKTKQVKAYQRKAKQ